MGERIQKRRRERGPAGAAPGPADRAGRQTQHHVARLSVRVKVTVPSEVLCQTGSNTNVKTEEVKTGGAVSHKCPWNKCCTNISTQCFTSPALTVTEGRQVSRVQRNADEQGPATGGGVRDGKSGPWPLTRAIGIRSARQQSLPQGRLSLHPLATCPDLLHACKAQILLPPQHLARSHPAAWHPVVQPPGRA